MTRRIITGEDIGAMPAGERLEVGEDTTVTASARELARRRGIEIVDVTAAAPGGAATSGTTAAEPVPGEANAPGTPTPGIATSNVPASGGERPAGIIVSAVGVNRPGILAEATAAVGELGGDIQDVSQRITGGYFNALLVVDIRKSPHDFGAFRDKLLKLSEPSDYVVTVIDERVFRAMHRI